MISSTVKEKKCGNQVQSSIKETFWKEKRQEKQNLKHKIIYMKVTLLKVSSMAKESISLETMVVFMKVNSSKMKCKVKESLFGMMVLNMKETLSKAKCKDMV